jgi:hypothetical protein
LQLGRDAPGDKPDGPRQVADVVGAGALNSLASFVFCCVRR